MNKYLIYFFLIYFSTYYGIGLCEQRLENSRLLSEIKQSFKDKEFEKIIDDYKQHRQSINLTDKKNIHLAIEILVYITKSYHSLGNYKEARTCFKNLKIDLKQADYHYKALYYNVASNIYLLLGNTLKSKEYIDEAVICLKVTTSLFNINQNYCVKHLSQKNEFSMCIATSASIYNFLGDFYAEDNDNNNSIVSYNFALKLINKSTQDQKRLRITVMLNILRVKISRLNDLYNSFDNGQKIRQIDIDQLLKEYENHIDQLRNKYKNLIESFTDIVSLFHKPNDTYELRQIKRLIDLYENFFNLVNRYISKLKKNAIDFNTFVNHVVDINTFFLVDGTESTAQYQEDMYSVFQSVLHQLDEQFQLSICPARYMLIVYRDKVYDMDMRFSSKKQYCNLSSKLDIVQSAFQKLNQDTQRLNKEQFGHMHQDDFYEDLFGGLDYACNVLKKNTNKYSVLNLIVIGDHGSLENDGDLQRQNLSNFFKNKNIIVSFIQLGAGEVLTQNSDEYTAFKRQAKELSTVNNFLELKIPLKSKNTELKIQKFVSKILQKVDKVRWVNQIRSFIETVRKVEDTARNFIKTARNDCSYFKNEIDSLLNDISNQKRDAHNGEVSKMLSSMYAYKGILADIDNNDNDNKTTFAESMLYSAIYHAQVPKIHADLLSKCYWRLATIQVKNKNTEAAKEYYETAIDYLETIIDPLCGKAKNEFYRGFKDTFYKNVRKLYTEYIELLITQNQNLIQNNTTESKKRNRLLMKITDKMEQLKATELINYYEDECFGVDLFQLSSIKELQSQDSIKKLVNSDNQINEAILKLSPLVNDQPVRKEIFISKINSLIDSNEALLKDVLEFSRTTLDLMSIKESEYVTQTHNVSVLYPILLPGKLLLILKNPKKGKEFFVQLIDIDATKVRKVIIDFSKNLQTKDSEYKKNAQKLYQWFIKPIEENEKKEKLIKETLVVIPSGIMHLISFPALLDNKERFFIEKHAVVIVPSKKISKFDYGSSSEAKNNTRTFFVAGIDDYSGCADKLSSLPFVKHEINHIKNLFNDTSLIKILQNEKVTRDAVYDRIKNNKFSILHFSTHGFFRGVSEESYLQLCEEKLSFSDLQTLIKYRSITEKHINLLVLSACETAAGDEKAALGLAGIALKTGAKSVLATQRNVLEKFSSDFFEHFYDYLYNNKESKALAYKKSLNDYISDTKGLGGSKHPYYWSPFILIGNWNKL